LSRIKYILLFGIVIAVIAVIIFLTVKWRRDDVYGKISVTGNYTISDSEILEFSGLNCDSVFSPDGINEKEITLKILKHPEIKKAVVRKVPPSEIVIEIIEKNPIAIINTGDDLSLIDEELEFFNFKNTEKLFDLPVINGIKVDKLSDNKKVVRDSDKLKLAVRILMDIINKKSGIQNYISEINMSDDNKIVMYTIDKAVPVYLPFFDMKRLNDADVKEELQQKTEVLKQYFEKIYPKQKNRNIKYIDLRFSNQAVVCFENEVTKTI